MSGVGANQVPCPRFGVGRWDCQETTPDGLLCTKCTSALRHACKQLAANWPDLQDTWTKTDRVDRRGRGGGGRGRFRSQVPLSLEVSPLVLQVWAQLQSWVQAVSESQGWPAEQVADVPSAALWLANRVQRLRGWERVGQLYEAVGTCLRQVNRVIDQPAEQVYFCACAICGCAVFGPKGREVVECRNCRRVVDAEDGQGYVPSYSLSDSVKLAKAAVLEQTVLLEDLRVAVRYVTGLEVNRKTLHTWVRRGRLRAAECEVVGRKLRYSVQDAVLLAQQLPVVKDSVVKEPVQGAVLS